MNKLMVGAMAFVLCLTSGFGSLAFAAETNGVSSQIDIGPVIPDNQDENIASYISIKPTGDSVKQDVEFKIKNGTDQKLTIKVEVLSGVTAQSGVIGYTANPEETDKVKESYQMAKYLTMPDSIELGPNELKVITGQIDVSGLTGTLLGAVGFEVDDSDVVEAESTESVNIKNKTKRVIGVVVEFGNTKNPKELDVKGAMIERTPAMYNINLGILNDNPVLYSGTDIMYEVFDYNGVSVFKPELPAKASITPNTEVIVSLPWESKTIEMGKEYTITGTISYGDVKTPFEQKIMLEDIKASSAKTKSDIFKPTELNGSSIFNNIWLYIVAGIIVVSGVIFIVIRRRND